jgi:hypothetical protein
MTTTYLRDICRAQQAAAELRYGFRVVAGTHPDDEVITLQEAREHLRVDVYDDPASEDSPPAQISDDDAWITAAIPAARAYCEAYLGRALATQTVEIASTGFPALAVSTPPGAAIPLPFGPVQSVEEVGYQDQSAYQAAYDAEFESSGDEALAKAAGHAALAATMPASDYEVDNFALPARLILAYGASWPTGVRSAQNSVRVRYVVGYSAPGASPAYPLPAQARAAILLMLSHLYEGREGEAEMPPSAMALLDLLPRERLGMA